MSLGKQVLHVVVGCIVFRRGETQKETHTHTHTYTLVRLEV